MKVLYAGSPLIAVPALEFLAKQSNYGDGFTLAGLLTNPDSPKSRSGKPAPTECAAVTEKFSPAIPVFKPEKLDSVAREQIAAIKPDLLVSFAYGKLFGPKFLALFPLGGINIHPSLLPKYRGATPIPAAILNRDTQTGISIQQLAEKLDCGNILAQEKVPLDGLETTASLSETMAAKAVALLSSTLKGILAGNILSYAQDHSIATYCPLLSKEDGLIDWNQSAYEIDARIRAFNPWPLSWTFHGGLQLFILKAKAQENFGKAMPPGQVLGKNEKEGIMIQTGNGILAVTELQYSTKKALHWKDFLNGNQKLMSERLG
ncbi:MAG: methionyl-tRNA formyltransferase [Treponema sp.]|nr:methionyl-tRNA formyltransferase [Treponema sp.]